MKTALSWLRIRFPLWWALAANLLIIYLTLPFYSIPSGTRIRPMGWSASIFIIGFVTLGAFCSALGELYERPKQTWAWIALFLSIAPIPIALLMLRHAVLLKELDTSS